MERKGEAEMGGGRILTGNGNGCFITSLLGGYMLNYRIWCMPVFQACQVAGVNDYTGFCRFFILGFISVALHLTDLRKSPESTVLPLKARG